MSRCCLFALLLVALSGCEALLGLKDREFSGDAADGGVDGGGISKPSAPKACEQYCERVQSACQGKYQVYTEEASCLALCALLSADDVACRDKEAQNAAASQEYWDHCQAAGPGGSTTCGGNCQSYCEVMDKACEMPEREVDVPTCLRKCGKLRDRELLLRGLPADTTRYDVSEDHEGDTLQCRIVHATIAVGAPEGHCWHAAIAPKPGPGGALNPCSTGISETAPHCEDYCGVVMKTCTAEHAVYETDGQCLAACGAFELGSVADDVGKDTIGCRKTHTYNALVTEDAAKHCPHSGPGGAGVCGDDCNGYCKLLEKGCKSEYEAKFGTGAAAATSCKTQCLAQRGEDPIHYAVESAESAPNKLACKLLYATRAVEKPGTAGVCESALGEGSCK